MASITAQNILDENNYTTSDISLANLERLIDNAIYYVELATNRSIAKMSGTAGSKTVSVADEEVSVVKACVILMLRAYLDRGPNTAISGLSISTLISDPQYTLYKDMIEKGVEQLRESDWSGAFI